MTWFFAEPSNDPYVSLTIDVNLEPGLRFLDAVEREHGERAGVQHLVTAVVARCLRDLPALNVKIIGRSFYQLDDVDIAVPVHLPAGESSARADETGMVVLRRADRMSLLDIARATRRSARAEREGRASLSGSAILRRLARRAPAPVVDAALAGVDGARRVTPLWRLVERHLGVSCAVTNVGAVLSLPEGARYRAASATITARLGHVASVFGLAPAAEAPVAEGGHVVVRRVLPITAIVDHRAIDGVLMGRMGQRLASLLLRPEQLTEGP